MKERHYKGILYFISSVILITLATQVYWNYKNYEAGKQQLVNDVQTSLDNAVSTYYETKAAQNTIGFFGRNGAGTSNFLDSEEFKNFSVKADTGSFDITSIFITDSLEKGNFLTIQGAHPDKIDSIINENRKLSTRNDTIFWDSHSRTSTYTSPFKDSLRYKAIKDLTTKIVVSFNKDTLDIKLMDSLFLNELDRKSIQNINHGLSYIKTGVWQGDDKKAAYTLNVTSNSVLLPKGNILKVGFKNIATIVLKRNLVGLLLSLLLLTAVVGSLLYLLRIIKEQKQLAEIKNDFISNITHEFKTPIATIGVALESIQHFNDTQDPEKTKKYVDMSSQQISKLNIMVEKLLETATLDSQALELNIQETNLYDLLESIQQKYSDTQEKHITLSSKSDQLWLAIDAFHIENAVDNIIDNAIKYGGTHIDIKLSKTKQGLAITISDNGNTLTKSQASQIFEKFYRVPKGNTHDIKGFGIGLYYTKTIIEKHGGSIQVATQPTTFKIVLPYV